MLAARGPRTVDKHDRSAADHSLDVGIASLENTLAALMDAQYPLATAYVDFVLQLCTKERARRQGH